MVEAETAYDRFAQRLRHINDKNARLKAVSVVVDVFKATNPTFNEEDTRRFYIKSGLVDETTKEGVA